MKKFILTLAAIPTLLKESFVELFRSESSKEASKWKNYLSNSEVY
jgi:hypothetical protein